jgi:hypothetical protein
LTLLDQITAALKCDEVRARQGLGPLFMLLKLATPRDIFARIQAVVPDAADWAHASAQGNAGRTGELLMLVTPDNIRARIRHEGYSEEEVDQLGQSVAVFLREHAGPEVAERVAEVVPLVSAATTHG